MGGRYDYPHYYFLNLVTDAGGGLEHKNSFLSMSGRFTTRNRAAPISMAWAWSRTSTSTTGTSSGCGPSSSGRFDYENEVHTKALWIAEGFTDYYAGAARQARRPVDARRISRRAVRSDRSACRLRRAAW